MSKYLIRTTEEYRVDTESEVEEILNEAKNEGKYELIKYTSSKKDIKEKKEIVDSYYLLSLKKQFTNEKEPESQYEVQYIDERSAGF